jgi:O-antigen/teichoic acid export membrane protein
MKNRIQNLLKIDLVRHNLIFFVGTLAIAVFNYLYYPIVGRLVTVSDFGEIQAIISLFMQLGIILTAFGYVVTNIISNTSDHRSSERLIIRLEQMTLVICVALFILLCLSSFVLKSSLKFTSVIPLLLVGALVVLNVPSTSRTYFLQGVKQLKQVSISGVIFSAGKLIISVVLILLGFSVVGVMIGYILAQTLTLLYLLQKTKGHFPGLSGSFQFKNKTTSSDRRVIKDELIYGCAILVLLSGITLLYSSDSIVVRLFFDSEESGLYSGISAVARIVFFVTASVAGVLIATVKMNDSRKHNLKVLYRSFGFVSLVGGLVTVFFAIFPNLSISLLFGVKYASSAYLLPLLALLMLVCSYNNLLICYEIALRRFKAIYIVGVSILALAILLSLFHDAFIEVIISYLAANLMVFVLLSIHILKRKHHA